MLRKLLAVLMALFSIIIIIELIYIFYLSPYKTIPAFFQKSVVTGQSSVFTYSENTPYDLILQGLKTQDKLRKEGLLISSNTEFIYEFEINGVELQSELPSEFKDQGYVASLTFKTKEGVNGFLFTQQNLDVMKVYEVEKGKHVPMSLEELKSGDRVRYITTYGLFSHPQTQIDNITILKL